MKYYVLAALALGATSCLNVGPDTCDATLITPVARVTGPRTVAVNQPATYTLLYSPTNGCGTLANLLQQTTGNTITVSANVSYTGCSCSTPATANQATYTFQPTQAGTYYLRFVATNAYIVDTLVAK